MPSEMAVKVVASIFITSFLGTIFTIKYFTSPVPASLIGTNEVQDRHVDYRHFLNQRNQLSRQMNRHSQEQGKKSCEIFNLFRSKPVHLSGGWCEQNISYGHKTDKQLAHALANFFIGKKVGSFGDGPGHYKAIIDSIGLLQVYDAYDGGPYYDEMSKGKVKYLDLSIPQYGLPLYDWVISLEVAEHIPRKYEAVYLDNLARHASEGIILSWAVPGQAGHYHINNRPFDYVVKTLSDLEFEFIEKETMILRKSATLKWLKDNVSVFRRASGSSVNLDDI